MIDAALKLLKDELNAYIDSKQSPNSNESLVVLSAVANSDGGWAIPPSQIGLSLINIEEEKVFKDQQYTFRTPQGTYEQYNPEIKLNLYVLICANYVNQSGDDVYEEGLNQLSNVISFFQGKNVFTPDNTPAMADSDLSKLVVELYSYSFEQQYNFWSILGAKYLPSVLYKVRLLAFQEKRSQGSNTPITNILLNTKKA